MAREKQVMMSSEENQLLSLIRKQNLTLAEAKDFVRALKAKQSEIKTMSLGENDSNSIVFGDPHWGFKGFNKAHYALLVKEANKPEIDYVSCTGDILDGWYQNRPQTLFEQDAIGLDQQLDMAIRYLSGIKKPLYFITGNHEHNTYKRSAGIEVGRSIEDMLNDKKGEAYFLGNGEGNLELESGIRIRLLHPDQGTAYALSYHPQKIIEALTGGDKPHILEIGHFHKAEYLFYRNVHAIQTGTLCGQSKFMRGRAIAAHQAFWRVGIYADKTGVSGVDLRLYPAYD